MQLKMVWNSYSNMQQINVKNRDEKEMHANLTYDNGGTVGPWGRHGWTFAKQGWHKWDSHMKTYKTGILPSAYIKRLKCEK